MFSRKRADHRLMRNTRGFGRSIVREGRLPFAAVLCSALFAAAAGSAEETAAGGRPVARLTVVRNVILAPVYVNGVGPYPFILDTCVPEPVLALPVAGHLGMTGPETDSTPAGIELESIELDSIELPVDRAVAMDLEPFEKHLGRRVAGILPCWLDGFALVLDFESGTIDVCGNPQNGSEPGYVVSAALGEAGLEIPVLIDGRKLELVLLDTTFGGVFGATAGFFRERQLMDDSTRRIKTPARAVPGETASGAVQLRIEKLQVAGIELKAPLCKVLSENSRARVGLGLLAQCRVTFDARRGCVLLDPIENEELTGRPVTGYGLCLDTWNDGYWSVGVARGSPAAEAGVPQGALLKEIDGKELRGLQYDKVEEAIAATPGETHAFSFVHDGTTLSEVTLEAATLLP